ncbi:MAG: GNAT family N-acetyltransferase [Phototrophicaceae bacterium]
MKFVQYRDIALFRQRVDDFLLREEVLNNIIIGITTRLMNGEQAGELFLGYVEDDASEVVATTMSTALRGSVLLSQISNTDAIAHLVSAYAKANKSLSSVEGSPEDSTQFAERWQEYSGQSFYTFMELGFYRLDSVIAPKNVSGYARPANNNDFNMLVDWLIQFSSDTGMNKNYSREIAENNIRRKLDYPILGGIRIWMDDNQPVSMAAATRETPNGGNISLVYTPDSFRGHGYASAITATVSQAILNTGKQFCFLTTDLANPTSNKIYKSIGYKHIGNQRRIDFEQSSGEA